MEPQIQYTKSTDGVSIAYWTLGGGPPLVLLPPRVFSHIGLEWDDAHLRGWYEHLAARSLVVRYDWRGAGLSERNVNDVSLAAGVWDLQAVVDRLGLNRFAMIGFGAGNHVALSYAAQSPNRVERLILSNPHVRTSDFWGNPVFREVLPLLDSNWELFTETVAHITLGWERGSAAHDWARFMRAAVTRDDFKRAVSVDNDTSSLLQRIEAPPLIIYSRRYPLEIALEVATGIPNARLVQQGADAVPGRFEAETRQVIDDFLAGGERGSEQAAEPASGTAIILFCDIVDSTALTERLGDVAFRDKARDLDGALRSIIRDNAGTPIEGKLLGDGVLAVFTSARQAIEAALACGRAGDEGGLPLHLGLHAGDVIREENNVYGGAVNIASRISGLSAPGEVLVSDTVRSLARTSAGVRFEGRGEQALKGIGEPVRVWAVGEGG